MAADQRAQPNHVKVKLVTELRSIKGKSTISELPNASERLNTLLKSSKGNDIIDVLLFQALNELVNVRGFIESVAVIM